MSANPIGSGWWREAGAPLVTPAVASAFATVLQCQLAQDSGWESRCGADDTHAAMYIHSLFQSLAKSASNLDSQTYLQLVRDQTARVARRFDTSPPWGSPNAALELTFREVLNGLAWRAAASSTGFAFDVASALLPLPPFAEVVLVVPGYEHSYVLALSEQMFTFANLVGKSWAQVLPLTSERGAQRLDLDREGWLAAVTLEAPGVQRFLEVMLAAQNGRPSHAEQYWPQGPWVELAQFIRDAMEYFIIGRGLAHVVLGHVRAAPVRAMPVGGRPVKVFQFSLGQEREADVQSLCWLLTADQFSHAPGMGGWAVILFFWCQLILGELGREREDEQDRAESDVVPGLQGGIDRLHDLLSTMPRLGPSGDAAVGLHRELAGLHEIMAEHLFNMVNRVE